MKYFIVLLILLAACVAYGQESQSVLANPAQTPAVAPAPVQQVLPSKIMVYRKGLFFWRMEMLDLVPVTPVIVVPPHPPKPTVIWTPTVIWR